jgi:hypothetical protein
VGLKFDAQRHPHVPGKTKACYHAVPELHRKGPLTMRKSLSSAGLKRWDEDRQQLVGFAN